MGKGSRLIKEALKELEDLDELVIDILVVDEDGLTDCMVFNTGELIYAKEKENA